MKDHSFVLDILPKQFNGLLTREEHLLGVFTQKYNYPWVDFSIFIFHFILHFSFLISFSMGHFPIK